jgi:hypothetical protein
LTENPVFLSIGSIILDEIVLPDRSILKGMLGGGMTHASMGMRIWADQIQLVSAVGQDFPDTIMNQLSRYFDPVRFCAGGCRHRAPASFLIRRGAGPKNSRQAIRIF